MKKLFCLAFAVFVLTVMCFSIMPARAAEVNFNGEYRVRGFAHDLDGTKDAEVTSSEWDQRFRLYITAKMSDNLKGVIRMLAPNHVNSESYDADSWGESVDPKVVLWDLAYLDFDIPQTNFNVKLGRQGIDLGNYIVLGSCKTYDSVVLNTKLQQVNLSLFVAKFYEGALNKADDEDLYGFALSFSPAANMNMGVFAALANDGDSSMGYIPDPPDPAIPADYPDTDGMWLGVTANMDIAPVKVKFEADYSSVTFNAITGEDEEHTGFAIFADVSSDLAIAKVGGNILYTTGADRDATDNDTDAFFPISSNFSERNDYDYIVMREYLYGKFGTDWSVGNLTAIQLYAMKDFDPKLSGKVSIQNYAFTEDPDGAANIDGGVNMDTAIGTEIDFVAKYKLYDNLTITGVAAYWMTDSDVFGDGNDDCWLLKHEILYKF